MNLRPPNRFLRIEYCIDPKNSFIKSQEKKSLTVTFSGLIENLSSGFSMKTETITETVTVCDIFSRDMIN